MLLIKNNKSIWILFYILLAIILVDIFAQFFGIQINKKILFRLLFLGIPVLLLLLHSFLTLSVIRGLCFVIFCHSAGHKWGKDFILAEAKSRVILAENLLYA